LRKGNNLFQTLSLVKTFIRSIKRFPNILILLISVSLVFAGCQTCINVLRSGEYYMHEIETEIPLSGGDEKVEFYITPRLVQKTANEIEYCLITERKAKKNEK